ncbi:MAG: DUF3179 domain-containing protein [Candidatus Glassbacteria bacterium]|nr:DUF3179 domain-containing protein [Candidatus Glassbacteria bacterium]
MCRTRHSVSLTLLALLMLLACGSDKADLLAPDGGGSPQPGSNEWLIPQDQIKDGGPGKDGIPSIDAPRFQSGWSNMSAVGDNDLVVIYIPSDGSQARAYPHPILDWHEVVNDRVGDKGASVTYCPLTGSTVIVDRAIVSGSGFGVSGLLYNNNLIMYDRATDSRWPQMSLLCANGPLVGTPVVPLPMIETTVATARRMFPNAEVLTTQTGHNQPYGRYPYGTYKTNSGTLFSISITDNSMHPKERIHGIIAGGASKAYTIKSLNGRVAINDQVGAAPVLIAGSGPDNFVVSFARFSHNGEPLTFSVDTSAVQIYPFNLRDDQTGSTWNILGQAISGELSGQRLTPTVNMNSYWFAWINFYPDTEVYVD